MSDDELVRTRQALHAVAEHVLAGPQHRDHGTIKLRVGPGGFGTWVAPGVAVVGTDLVAGGRSHPIDGRTARALGEAVGVAAGAPADVYGDGGALGVDDELTVAAGAADRIAGAWARGEAALRELVPGCEPVLWPEHFDVGIRDDGVNYGVSPGDGYSAEPYAYVGVDPVPSDPFWNAPFGRTAPMTALPTVEAVLGFFAEGRRRAGQ